MRGVGRIVAAVKGGGWVSLAVAAAAGATLRASGDSDAVRVEDAGDREVAR